MNMEYGLFQEQTQRLVMTTQMKQAIEILQYSNHELSEYLLEAAEKNPLLEVESVAEPVLAADFLRSRLDSRRVHSKRSEQTGSMTVIEQLARAEVTPTEWLEGQLNFLSLPLEVLQTAKFLVGSLDESGYLRESDELVAGLLQVSEPTVQQAREALQQCEPTGIGARDLRECLLLQVSLLPETYRDLGGLLIQNHLEEIASGKLSGLAKRLKVSVEDVQATVDAIKRLNPRPGLHLQINQTEYVVPDVVVQQVEGEWLVVTNESALAQVRLNREYSAMLPGSKTPLRHPGAHSDYLASKFQSAKWLMRCLEQRRLTLHRVAEAIVSTQTGFFDHGPQALKPLTLHQIAEELGIHESTVSRAVRGKYMQTPRGVVELKYFFSAEVAGNTGARSATSAKYLIQKLVREEDPGRPLSDEALVASLTEQGVRISRRTVAKYREELRILPSWRRKRFDVGS